jgi:hypothetical protein
MGAIVNLRRVKKARRLAADAKAAQENRIRHGRTGAAKAEDERAARAAARATDAARLDAAKDPPPTRT